MYKKEHGEIKKYIEGKSAFICKKTEILKSDLKNYVPL